MDSTALTTWLTTLIAPLILIVTLALMDFIGGTFTAAIAGKFKLEKAAEFGKTLIGWLYAWFAAETLTFLPGFLGVQVEGYKEAYRSKRRTRYARLCCPEVRREYPRSYSYDQGFT